ncbi:MAG TPA: serine/threonine-protein kinase, partial [Candidatus Melainabacteria bacterium]|nr:serine/threonine-protein kinase [Candidatus Melainabacteria bacterium]
MERSFLFRLRYRTSGLFYPIRRPGSRVHTIYRRLLPGQIQATLSKFMDGKSLEKQNSVEDLSADLCAEPAAVEELEPELPKMGDRFEILEILGSGGMGSVYRVKDRSIDEEYAVKILKAEIAADKQAVKRFELEVRAQESLSHPNLVPVFGQGHTLDGEPYMIMGLSEGVSLEAEIARGRKFSEDEVLSFVEQVAEALSHAHSKRIVHRDIKPGNILL